MQPDQELGSGRCAEKDSVAINGLFNEKRINSVNLFRAGQPFFLPCVHKDPKCADLVITNKTGLAPSPEKSGTLGIAKPMAYDL